MRDFYEGSLVVVGAWRGARAGRGALPDVTLRPAPAAPGPVGRRRAAPRRREVPRVGERALHPETVRRVRVRQHLVQEGLLGRGLAPHLQTR